MAMVYIYKFPVKNKSYSVMCTNYYQIKYSSHIYIQMWYNGKK